MRALRDLAAARVDVWLVALGEGGAGPASAWALLSPDERLRAERLAGAPRSAAFVRARAALRTLLAAYTGLEATRLVFRSGPNGKPSLAGWPDLGFNLSHSAGLAAIAVARGRQLGVDVQRIREGVEVEAVAERWFAPEEQRALARLPVAERRLCFFRWWARKEAFVKAWGGRLESGTTTQVADPAAPICGWARCDLALPDGYVGALAAERGPLELELRCFPELRAL